MPAVTRRLSRTRLESREVAELRALAAARPELAEAAALQIELAGAERRVRTRLPTPRPPAPTEVLHARLAAGVPLLRFDDLPVEWAEVRLLFRQVTDVLRRHGHLAEADAARLQDVARRGDLTALARRWFDGAVSGGDAGVDMLDEVLGWALRPVLARMAEVLQPVVEAGGWTAPSCPVCGGPPELGYITSTGRRVLLCGRCHARWRFDDVGCPFCANRDPTRMTAFATRDGCYRIAACRACGRYLKVLDGRRAQRPPSPVLDAIATLPLDAAAIQQGFRAG